MRSRVGLPLLSLVVGACASSSLGPELADLKAQHEREKVRLQEVRRQIVEAQAEADQAQLRAAFQECRSEAAAIRSEVSVRQSQCAEEIASFNACAAEDAKNAAKGSALICLIGIGATFATGGAAAPLAAGGCALSGLAEGGSSCGEPPACARNLEALRTLVLADRNSAYPSCGGNLGANLAPRNQTAERGVLIEKVGPRTMAHDVALRAGDIVIAVNDTPVDQSTIADVLWDMEPGDPVALSVVRDGGLFVVKGKAGTIASTGLDVAAIKLGVQSEGVRDIAFRAGVHVAALDAGSPAKAAGIQVGDIVEAIGERRVGTIEDAQDALNEVPPGEEVRLQLLRRGDPVTITLRTDPKGPAS